MCSAIKIASSLLQPLESGAAAASSPSTSSSTILFPGDNHNRSKNLALPSFKWRLVVSYDGTRFSGWQYQPSIPTVQCILEQALTRITKLERKDLQLVGAGRTDAGVHAWGQVAHFITPFNFDTLDGIHRSINGLLPSDIRVREISAAAPEFHARLSVISKTYEYKVYNDTIMDPFQRLYAYHSIHKLNVDAMRDAAKYLTGKHDFSSLANASKDRRVSDPVKSILRFGVIQMGPILQLEVEGSGFHYRQVRNMVGLLLQVGREAVPPDIVPKILESCDRKQLAKYALPVPANALSLKTVKYKEEHLHLPPGSPMTSFGMHHSIRKCKLPCF
ncbi:hypothetical protein DM860_002603 [Cuscuta australis]|uniref:tRNA pseudouridine synthase n=1 Tax=Cuscuta australis TaxID=267555 RepID=A0A328CYU0_9ASTE|nr:hypothetical protein DM860_002603 [Cuscuta australis]